MRYRQIFIAQLLCAVASWAGAQNAAPAKAPGKETLEPAVDTSAPAEHATKNVDAASTASSSPAEKPAAAVKSNARTGKAADRLELDTTQITGNRELPKVLYIVPWKRSDLGDLVGKPVNSLLDEVLAPVDRDVFQRENRYYRALQPDAAAAAPNSTPAGPPARPE